MLLENITDRMQYINSFHVNCSILFINLVGKLRSILALFAAGLHRAAGRSRLLLAGPEGAVQEDAGKHKDRPGPLSATQTVAEEENTRRNCDTQVSEVSWPSV